jgi:transposase-like protein
MQKSNVLLSEIIELYVNREMSVTQVANHFGVSKQAISLRLKRAGISTRPAAHSLVPKAPRFERSVLEKLYIDEGLTVEKVAERLRTTPGRILQAMYRHGIKRRRPGASAKYPEIRKLKVGESVNLPKGAWQKPNTEFYSMAKVAGIRVSTRTIDAETMRVTRIA